MPEPPRPFGSYAEDDVTFLLTDLTDRMEESSLSERAAHLAVGGHYSELLPTEYEPTPVYREMFELALVRKAEPTAEALAVMVERMITDRHEPTVLVSLARAGTPVGVLVRTYLLRTYGVALPHYSISIVRGRGIDQVAIRYLQDRHPDSRLQFIDGWTGKGAIQRELTSSCARLGLDDRLAVIADPAWCTPLAGTRDDLLIPSACLNSTVSGLVSRTVLREDLIGPDDFHGAKEYRELAHVDVSQRYIDEVAQHFTPRLAERARLRAATPLAPVDWSGWKAVERIGRRFGIDDANRIKPGVGEATRVLLRRVPKLLLLSADGPDVAHLRQLADERSVEVAMDEDMPFQACGLIA